MFENAFKEKLSRGELTLGLFVPFYAPSLVEIIGYAGLDFIVIDNEHGAFTDGQIEELIRAAELTGLAAIVRVSYDNSGIQKALDRGAKGVQVPMVNTKGDAEAVVRKAKFPPYGTRGTAYSVRAARFGNDSGKEYLEAANRNTMVIVHIETPEAVENFEEIISVPGIDVAFIGPTDLSVTMGYQLEGPNHPAVKATIKELLRKGKEKGITMGVMAGGIDDIGRCAGEGAKVVTLVSSGLISAKFKEMVKAGRSNN
ncbi:MAG: rhmA [Firmicutes bacterium]|nr:rhmA [Bacillota bacterium]